MTPARAILFPLWLLPTALLVGCASKPMSSPPPANGCVAPGYTSLGDCFFLRTMKLDVAFLIDNSPSMAPKREKLMRQLPGLLSELRDPNDDSLPALRVAMLDGDLGSGGVLANGACAARNGSIVGDGGALQMAGGLDCGATDPMALWLETTDLGPANFTGDIAQVFTCLAGNLGQAGCGYQQLLQAAISPTTTGPATVASFARPDAYLGLVIISDQDDCSVMGNTGVLSAELPTESPTLRCATRGHACGGQNLAYPTTAAYAHPFSDCAARTDERCPEATDTPMTCGTLAAIHSLADRIKALKTGRADDMIGVSGVFGWPRMSDMTKATYQIAPVPNPDYMPGSSLLPTIHDLWPICFDPDHPPASPDPATGFDAIAASHGAKPGLRLAAFIDEFGDNGRKVSMCEPDWKPAMVHVGSLLPHLDPYRCVMQDLVDADPATTAIEPDCIVEYLEPKHDGAPTPSCSPCPDASPCPQVPGPDPEWTKTYLSRCDDHDPVPPCWRLVVDRARCPGDGRRIDVRRLPTPYTLAGTRVQIQCRVCPDPAEGVPGPPGC